MSATIRPAGMDDRPAIEAIVESAYAHYVPRIGRRPAPMDADYAAFIGQGRTHVLAGSGGLLGVVVLIPEEAAMLLEVIAVRPDVKGQGFGRMLLEFAETTARGAGYAVIRLYTNAAMVENIALYSGIGYVETHRAGEKGFLRVFMTKALT